MTEKPLTKKPLTKKPSTEKSLTKKPSTEKSLTKKPSTEKSLTKKPSTEKPLTEKSLTKKPSTEQPSTEQPSTEKPSTEQPSTEQPSTEKPSTEQPSTEKPSTEKPLTDKPSTDKPLKLTLRDLTLDDLSQLVFLENLTQAEPWPAKHFISEMTRPFTVTRGIFWGENLIASLLAWLLPPDTHLLSLAVTPKFEGLRIAASLLADLVELTRAAGGDKIFLETATDNFRAIRLYRAAGFKIEAVSMNYYKSSDAFRMTLLLKDWPGYNPRPDIVISQATK